MCIECLQLSSLLRPFLDLFFRDQSVIDDPDFQEEAQEELRGKGHYGHGVEEEFMPAFADESFVDPIDQGFSSRGRPPIFDAF